MLFRSEEEHDGEVRDPESVPTPTAEHAYPDGGVRAYLCVVSPGRAGGRVELMLVAGWRVLGAFQVGFTRGRYLEADS